MFSALLLLAAVTLDALLGEPRRYHPLVGFGRLAHGLERALYGGEGADRALRGGLALVLAVLPLVLAALLLRIMTIGWLVDLILLTLALGGASLYKHGVAVAEALAEGDLDSARERVGWIVSRDTRELDEEGVARAACESVLENGNDAIFGAIFWFLLLGGPGVMIYRLSNTLDAMWGYRNERYRDFGWAAARWDDLLNWAPARLTALSYALMGKTATALRCWRTQAGQHASPNAGAVMAAGAGALGLQLGGGAVYHGEWEERPVFGEGRAPNGDDIIRCLRLVRVVVLLWIAAALVWGLFGFGWFAMWPYGSFPLG